MIRLIAIASTLLLSACDTPEYQTTSGASYLAKSAITEPIAQNPVPTISSTGQLVQIPQKGIADFANYEPRLTLPARIGIVRLVYQRISTAPSKELELFSKLDLRKIGNFTQLGRLEAQMAGISPHRADNVAIRKLAASRHLDYVLVVSLDPDANTSEALFMDVRTGYPYASIESKLPGSGSRGFWGSEINNQNRLDASTYKLARHLAPKLEEMLVGLKNNAGQSL